MQFLEYAWGLVGYIAPFVFVLTIVVFFHELGHFLVGRWCGVKVDAFSIGFGPEIAAVTDRRGTRWRLAWVPLGGYVKFHGDPNGASAGVVEGAQNMPAEERKVSFFAQPVWKRALIVFAGPAASFLLGIVIFAGSLYIGGRTSLAPVIENVRAGDPAAAAGLMKGDLIVSIDGQNIKTWSEMQRIVQSSADQALTFVVQRGSRDETLKVTPKRRDLNTPFGVHRVGLIGVEPLIGPNSWVRETFTLPQSVRMGFSETWFIIERTGAYIAGLFAGRESTDQISGPIRIAEISGEFAKVGFSALIHLAAVLSVSIGLLNLMPVPMLDGGHLLFYAIEAVKGRPLSERNQELGFRVGMGLVMALMLFATFNDILHVGPKLMRLFG
ncbi:MAG: RIP metalloprotease RseP [Beijerinckiaceae bacterium]